MGSVTLPIIGSIKQMDVLKYMMELDIQYYLVICMMKFVMIVLIIILKKTIDLYNYLPEKVMTYYYVNCQ